MAAVGPAQILEILSKITDKLDAHERVIKQLAQEAANRSVQAPNVYPVNPAMQVVPGTQMVAQAGPGAPPFDMMQLLPLIEGFLKPKAPMFDTLTAQVTQLAQLKQAFDIMTPRTLTDRIAERILIRAFMKSEFIEGPERLELQKELGRSAAAAAGVPQT